MLPPSSLVISQGWGLIDLPLRASNEGLLRPRVARAQKIIRLHPLLCSALLCEKKGHLAAPIPSFQARSYLLVTGGPITLPLRATFSPAHPLADIFYPPCPPIASQSISRDMPLARARGIRDRALRKHRRLMGFPRLLNPPASLCHRSIFRGRWGRGLSSGATMWRRRSWRCSHKGRRPDS